jgi:hypothetical protein
MIEIGPQRIGDRRGWLVFEYLPDDLQRAEDATQAADYERRGSATTQRQHEYDPARGQTVWYFTRPATPAERTLLEHLGYTLPAELTTRVEFLTETLRQRRWPQLETTN